MYWNPLVSLSINSSPIFKATNARITLHVKVVYGENDHHKAESAFKATALALKQAIAIDPSRLGIVPSTKGVL
jgi:imidazoleglycerol-phosphate dehydratase